MHARKIYLLFAFLVGTHLLIAQSFNSFNEARNLPVGQSLDFTVCSNSGGTINEYFFATKTPSYGTLSLAVTGTNNSANNGYIYLYVYDGRKLGGQLLASYVQSTSIAPGATASQTFLIPALQVDSVFIRVTSTRCFAATIAYNMVNVPPLDLEPNGSVAQATELPQGAEQAGNIGYRLQGNTDVNDYYQAAFSENGSFRLQMSATNRGGGHGYVYVYIYDSRGLSGQQFAGYLNNVSRVAPNSTVEGTITLHGRAGDTVYIRVTSSSAFTYSLQYNITTVEISDPEPNGSFATATPINQSQTRQGIIGYYSKGGNDADDYYATKTNTDGAIRIFVEATNRDGKNGYVYMYGYDKRKASGQQFATYLKGTNHAPGVTLRDTITVFGQLADSFYFRLVSSAAFTYNLRYEVVQETQSQDPEPNNTFAEAIAIPAGTPITARIGYTAGGVTDASDYFLAPLTGIGTLRVIVKGTNQGTTNGYMYAYVYDGRKGSGQLMGAYVQTSAAAPGAQVVDTFYLYGRRPEDYYVHISSTRPFNYTIQYDLVDAQENDPEPNNTIAEATPIAANQTGYGNIGFTASGVDDANDYYKLEVPANTTLQIVIHGKNYSAAAGYMYCYVYDKRGLAGQLFGGYLQSTSIPRLGQLTDTITLTGRGAGVYYLRITSSRAFAYDFSYQLTNSPPQDAEPNGTLALANGIAENEWMAGNIGYANGTAAADKDDDDYYTLNFRSSATWEVIVQGTNTGSGSGYMYAHLYDSRGASGQILANYVQGSSIAKGTAIADTFRLTGKRPGAYFIRLSSNGSFAYQVKYRLVDEVPEDEEPNGTFITAIPLPVDSVAYGNIGYTSGQGADTEDYYAGYLPKQGTLRLIIQATNMGASNGYVYHYGYDGRKASGQLFGRYLKGSSISPGTSVLDTILVSCRGIDSFFHRITAAGAWQYQWHYEMINTSMPESDTNDALITATPLPIAHTAHDNIGYASSGKTDANDYFITVKPGRGTLRYIISAQSQSTSNGNLYAYIYEKRIGANPVQVAARYLGGGSSLPGGTSFTDTLVFNCSAFDTLYLRITSSGCWSYTATPEFIDREPVAVFTTHLRGGLYEFVNHSTNAGKYNWQLGDNTQTTRVAPDLKAYKAGFYAVRLIAENAVCPYRDTLIQNIVVNGLDRYGPHRSGPGNIEFTAYGGGFLPGMRVKMSGNGLSFSDTVSLVSQKGNQFNAFVDLHDAVPGLYDVEIKTGDTTYFIKDGFTVEPGVDKLRTEIVGRDILRANTVAPVQVRVHNDGNTMAGMVEVYVLFPEYMEVTLLDSIWQLVTPNEPDPQFDSTKVFRRVTKAKQGYPNDGNLYALYIVGIPPGGYRDVSFTIKSGVGTVPIRAWVIGPNSGSGYKGWFDPCNQAKMKLALDLLSDGLSAVPIADCAFNIGKGVITGVYNAVTYALGYGPPPAVGVARTLGQITKNCAGEALAAAGLAPGLAYEIADVLTDVAILGSNLDLNYQLLKDACAEEPKEEKEKPVDVRTSWDPNAKTGPNGIGAAGYINGADRVAHYTIFFENLDSATLPAQTVTIIDTLDKAVFDLSSFRGIDFTIGNKRYSLPMQANDYVMDVPYDALYNVRFAMSIDTTTGIVTATLRTISKNTGALPDDPLAGFLPPNQVAPEGEGSISFFIHRKDGLPDGTVIANKASIIFDENEPIVTDLFINTLDRNLPNSRVITISQVTDTSAVIRLNGTDPASGVRQYKIYMSTDDGPFVLLGISRADTLLFTGLRNQKYSFYSVAVDKVGNEEQKLPGAEASIVFDNGLPVSLIHFTGRVQHTTNVLQWSTATEQNNRGFYMQRSADGVQFNDLAFVASSALNGNSNLRTNYQFTDVAPPPVAYYRLRQVDFNGQQTTSHTVLLNRQATGNLNLVPNPANNFFSLNGGTQVLGLRLLDMQGKLIQYYAPNAQNRYSLPALPNGLYMLIVNTQTGVQMMRLQIAK